jgi:hypothetical protein
MADSFLVNLSERWAQGSSGEATISVVFEFRKWTTVTGLLPAAPSSLGSRAVSVKLYPDFRK